MKTQVYKSNADRFNTLSVRERIQFGLTILVVVAFSWWHFFAAPTMTQIENLQVGNEQMNLDVSNTQASIDQINARLNSGVHKEKTAKLERLKQELMKINSQVRLQAAQFVDPEEMFQLMTQMIYKESKLKLLNLKRREVTPAIKPVEGQDDNGGIYRHVLEVQFSGKYEDIFIYMKSLEALDWKLIWEKIEISTDDYPVINVKVVISTLSTRKEWVGV